jgi:hypothetical protein
MHIDSVKMLVDMRLGGVNSWGPRLGQGYIVRSSSLQKGGGMEDRGMTPLISSVVFNYTRY